MQWTEWTSPLVAQSSLTLRQLVDWLRHTHHLPVKCLQYEGYPPLYNEAESRNEAEMDTVRRSLFLSALSRHMKRSLQKLVDVITYKSARSGRCILIENSFIDVSIEIDCEKPPQMALPCLRVVLDTA